MVKTRKKPSPRSRAPTYMTGAQYRAAVKALGLSVAASSEFLRVTACTNSRRRHDKAPVPWELAALLRLMIKLKLRPEHIERLTAPQVK